jgi:hypothetical protein
MNIKHLPVHLFILLAGLYACKPKSLYINQAPPDTTPQLFMPGSVNTECIELNGVFNTSFTEFFFTRIIGERFVIHHIELINGEWTSPAPIEVFPDPHVNSTAVDMSVT